MNSPKKYLLTFCCLNLLFFSVSSQVISWNIDALDYIGGNLTKAAGNPTIISDSNIKAVLFDGVEDQLLITADPLSSASEFTIELIFKPYDAYFTNPAPRMLHIANMDDTRRITIEARISADNKYWCLDAFLKNESDRMVLKDTSLVHPVNVWSHIAITYKDNTFTTFINGVQELSGHVSYLPISGSDIKTSLGCRQNLKDYFKGEISKVMFTHMALASEQFSIPEYVIKTDKALQGR